MGAEDAKVSLDSITVKYGQVTAVNNVSLDINKGEFFSFLGPSGCGKTTLLRMISGFTEPSEGTLRIDGLDMRNVQPNRRPTALIFQSLALFPLMTVAENIGYGLRVRGVAKLARRQAVERLLNTVALEEHADKKVTQLSGGQRQRVAIARALAVEPAVLLLDEPLSALDLKLRVHMRKELREIQKRVGLTFIYITHDQGEALVMSDRIGVMNNGRLEQVGNGKDLYTKPLTGFVASFLGDTNQIPGLVVDRQQGMAKISTALGEFVGQNPRQLHEGTAASIFVRPENLIIDRQHGENSLPGVLLNAVFEGNLVHTSFKATEEISVTSSCAPRDYADKSYGSNSLLSFSSDDATILPINEGAPR